MRTTAPGQVIPGGSDRALTLARRAITDYETAGDAHTKYLDEVRAWLDAHRLRR